MNATWNSVVVLTIAASLDYLIGDPWGWLHPVQVMGWAIDGYRQLILNRFKNARVQRWAGVVLALGLVVGSGVLGGIAIWGAAQLHPGLGMVVETVMLASCLAGRSLRDAAADVLQPLERNDLIGARQRLALYVGRDTEALNQEEILRAVLETVSENATDGVMAPLFYAMVGMGLTPIGAVPLAIAYKAASTLDSMVGYREPPYTHLGWFGAKLEDILTWIPCRLTVVTLGLVSGKLPRVLSLCQRDAVKDSSPNSGWSECAYGAILGVQLGGTNFYRGVAKHKPCLGDPDLLITPASIEQALQLTRYCFLTWLGVVVVLSFVVVL